MKYDFDSLINRRNTNSYKWDSHPGYDDMIPLWVADMDFRTAPEIIEAVKRRADMGVFGYTFVPDMYYDAVIGWFERRHGWKIGRDEIIYTSGVVPAVSAVIKALTSPGDKVMVQTPVYNCFFSSVRNNGCVCVDSPLRYENGRYFMDFDDFEAKAADPSCRLFVLCNPHNPVGRVWHSDELKRIGEICAENDVIVVSDEIHCELVYGHNRYMPFANVAKGQYVVCISPSKAFNIAGLQIANIVVPDPLLRKKIDRAINDNEVCDVNPFGVDALIAAYGHGLPWLEELLEYLYDNYLLIRNILSDNVPAVKVCDLEGTYLAWIDCRAIGMDSVQIVDLLKEKAHVLLNPGTMYGKDGEGFIRINLACQRTRLEEAMNRIVPLLASLV